MPKQLWRRIPSIAGREAGRVGDVVRLAQALAVPAQTPAVSVDDVAAALPRVLADATQPTLVFQPIVDLVRGRVTGYEALARFSGPPTATPDRWFSAAAREGLSSVLESRVALAALRARRQLPPDCFLTFNLSPAALTSAPVMDVLLRAAPLGSLFVEVTEDDRLDDLDELAFSVARLREAGALIALDDAGAGYSGLHRLVVLRPELVKLDRSLVDHLDTDEAKRATVEMLGTLAGRLDSWLLAEGIERRAELRELARLGVPLGQGYLLGRPAAHWATLPPELAQLLQAAAHPLFDDGAAVSLADDVPVVPITEFVSPPDSPADPARCAAVLDSMSSDIAILTDADHRPVGLIVTSPADPVRAGFGGGAIRLPVSLKTQAAAPIRDVVERALMRSAPRRFDPVVCVDERGRVVGVIRPERLFGHQDGRTG